MANNKKPRKKYRPRPVIADPVQYVVGGFKPPEPDKTLRVKLLNHGAMKALTDGSATKTEWDYVCTALNVAVVLAEHGIGDEYIEKIKKAMIAHAQCGKRLYQSGKLGYTGEQLTTVNFALEVHDAQMDTVTVAELEKAHMEVSKRLRDKKISYRVKELA
jgi:hypothetical protein